MKRNYLMPRIEYFVIRTESGFELSDAGVANVGYDNDVIEEFE